jgi:nucleotide-binding universal stress UspA family protein
MACVRAAGSVMPMTHPIVVAVSEGDEAREAVALGVAAARLLGAPLVLAGVVLTVPVVGATVVPGWSPVADGAPLRDYVAKELHRHADDVPDDVPCTIQVATATAVLPGLAFVVEREQAQLAVVGASHLGPFARAVRGDIGLGAARRVGCSVLVASASGTSYALPPERIGVAWDGTEEAERALELAVALAARGGAELTVLRAAGEHDATEASQALDDLAERVACTTRLLPAPAAGALVATTAEIDLLVLGARHRKLPGAHWLGSVSTPVLRHAQCPVLVVPADARVPAAA